MILQLNQTLYPEIFTRKSTRSYSGAQIPADDFDSLRAFMTETVPLFPDEQAMFDIQPHKNGAMKIAAYAEHDRASLLNVAFMLQQMDLFIQSLGMGALWNATVGSAKKRCEGLPYVICLVFGVAKESASRTDASQYNRKRPDEISDRPQLPLVEAVRLAPSARNRQLWYLSCGERYVDFYCKKGGVLDKTLLKNLNRLDMGIAVCHAALALQKEGFTPNAFTKTGAPDKEGCDYCVSLNY